MDNQACKELKKKTRVKKRGQKYDVGDKDDVEEPPFESIRGMMTI